MQNIKIAMIQLNNYYQNQIQGYKEAEILITEAASKGADLAVLPELSACGYIPNQSIWKYSETLNGKSSQWACNLSMKLGIYIGAGFIETDGKDFYNSYLVAGPKGNICGIIRKEDAESYCFKRKEGDLYIDTDIGRIGIGICADNHNIKRLNRMKDVNIDFMIMPHANPSPYKTNKKISENDTNSFRQQPYIIASAYSNYLRVPTLYVNSVGDFPEFSGGFAVKSFNEDFCLMGGSLAVDSDGKTLALMDSQQGYEIVTIPIVKNLNPTKIPVVYHSKWLHPGNAIFRYLLMPLLIAKGIRSYKKQSAIYLNSSKGR